MQNLMDDLTVVVSGADDQVHHMVKLCFIHFHFGPPSRPTGGAK